MHPDFRALRRFVDGSDFFMSSKQVVKPRGRAGGIKRHIPDWTKDDDKIRELLLRSFPNWQTDPKQLARMGIWCRTIYLYYRFQISAGEVAKDMGDVPLDTIRNRLSRIRNAAKGLNTAGKQRDVKVRNAKEASVKRRETRREKARLLGHFEDKLTPKGWRLGSDDIPVPTTWRRVRDKNRGRVVPKWAKDQRKVIEILKTSFLRWRFEQLEQAKRWYQIIYYYHRKKATRKEVARLMNTTDGQVRDALVRISRAAAGQNTAGRTRRQIGAGKPTDVAKFI